MMAFINKFLKPVTQAEIDSVVVCNNGTSALEVCVENDKPKITPVSSSTNIKEYFNSKGFEIKTDDANLCVAPIEELAFFIALNYRSCKDFLRYIRDNVAKKNFHINYSIPRVSDNDKDAIVEVAETFGEYGIIANVHCNPGNGTITGVISSAPRIINLLNGDFLEFFGRVVAEKVVKESAEKYGVDFEIYSNVIISKDTKPHELDIVFRVGDKVFWSEIKSGKFSDFDTYRKLGMLMGVNPDRHILLAAEKTDRVAEGISWLYQFYVANIESFKDKLVEMIDNAF